MFNRRFRVPTSALASVALLAFFSTGCQRQAENADAGDAAKPTASAPASLESLKAGEFAELDLSQDMSIPTSAVLDGDGNEHTLQDYAGKVVVLNIWAEWCAPCVEEMPTLAALQKEFPKDQVAVVPVAFGYADKRDSAKARLAELVGQDLPFFYDPSYNVTYDAKTGAFPSTIIYGKDGKEAARLLRPANWASPEAKALIEAVAAGAS